VSAFALPTSARVLRLAVAMALLAAAAGSVQAQTSRRSVRGVPQPMAPAPATPELTPSLVPSPAAPGTTGGRASNYTAAGAAPQSSVMGAAGYGAAVAGVSPVTGSGPVTALQIAQSFLAADGNRDGELTRAEARHLTLMPYSFEEMDRDHDGILTRSEYEDAFR
jgi:hypothetical protein